MTDAPDRRPPDRHAGAAEDELTSVIAQLRGGTAAPHGLVRVGEWDLEYQGPRAFGSTLDLLLSQRIYEVPSMPPGTLVVDGGAYLGVSVLLWIRDHPGVRVIAFEPDPEQFPILERNILRNGAAGRVTLVNAALSRDGRSQKFHATGTDSGTVTAGGWGKAVTVDGCRLSEFIDGPVGLLKLNVEGAEWDVVDELGDRLAQVDQVLIEYHGFWQLPQTLHSILASLDHHGFRYVLSHFNDTNKACVPPLTLPDDHRYFLLVYARRMSAEKRI